MVSEADTAVTADTTGGSAYKYGMEGIRIISIKYGETNANIDITRYVILATTRTSIEQRTREPKLT